jgi:hypothetical protein
MSNIQKEFEKKIEEILTSPNNNLVWEGKYLIRDIAKDILKWFKQRTKAKKKNIAYRVCTFWKGVKIGEDNKIEPMKNSLQQIEVQGMEYGKQFKMFCNFIKEIKKGRKIAMVSKDYVVIDRKTYDVLCIGSKTKK